MIFAFSYVELSVVDGLLFCANCWSRVLLDVCFYSCTLFLVSVLLLIPWVFVRFFGLLLSCNWLRCISFDFVCLRYAKLLGLFWLAVFWFVLFIGWIDFLWVLTWLVELGLIVLLCFRMFWCVLFKVEWVVVGGLPSLGFWLLYSLVCLGLFMWICFGFAGFCLWCYYWCVDFWLIWRIVIVLFYLLGCNCCSVTLCVFYWCVSGLWVYWLWLLAIKWLMWCLYFDVPVGWLFVWGLLLILCMLWFELNWSLVGAWFVCRLWFGCFVVCCGFRVAVGDFADSLVVVVD